LIAAQGDPEVAMAAARHEARAVDPRLIVSLMRLRDVLGLWLKPLAVFGTAGASLAGFALLLASIGIHGVVSYSVSQRTREIGVRVALGASRNSVLWLILRQGMRLTLIGVLVGLFGSFALSRILSSVLYGLSPLDPIAFISVSALAALVTLLACWRPARHAAKIDPMEALRYE
jgi:ABC-type antimicrobial peptide transport system permease subunit